MRHVFVSGSLIQRVGAAGGVRCPLHLGQLIDKLVVCTLLAFRRSSATVINILPLKIAQRELRKYRLYI